MRVFCYSRCMDFLTFSNVHYEYPPFADAPQNDENKPMLVFHEFSATLPAGFVSLVGPNGSGKSTFMLLAAGRLLPNKGNVLLLGKDTAKIAKEDLDFFASYIYQNMELETDEKVSTLLDFVYKNGSFKGNFSSVLENKKTDFLSEIKEVFELQPILDKNLNAISKGEMQRVYLAFALLHGSKSIFMDEPMFAMEDSQKEKSLSYIKAFSEKTQTPIYISMHELDLTRKFAETVMLFYPNHNIDVGTPSEVLTNEDLEKAYGVPASMLKHSEDITREQIINEAKMLNKN